MKVPPLNEDWCMSNTTHKKSNQFHSGKYIKRGQNLDKPITTISPIKIAPFFISSGGGLGLVVVVDILAVYAV